MRSLSKPMLTLIAICCAMLAISGCRGIYWPPSDASTPESAPSERPAPVRPPTRPVRPQAAPVSPQTSPQTRPVRPPVRLATEPARRALLIGVSRYQNLPQLPGARNDIALVQRVLQTKLGFAPTDIRLLLDEDATRAGILQALYQLTEEARPQDFVYVHYSGHGSQAVDINGDERDDRRDETIVPVNGRSPGVPDITDDELQMLLARLKSEHAVIVLDACHSGTATRGFVRTRAVPLDNRVALYRGAVKRTRAIVPLISSRHVLLTGAAAHEEALEAYVTGAPHGLFTYALMNSLSASGPQVSAVQLLASAKEELKRLQPNIGRYRMPEPQLEAPVNRLHQALFPSVSPRLGASGGAFPQQGFRQPRR